MQLRPSGYEPVAIDLERPRQTVAAAEFRQFLTSNDLGRPQRTPAVFENECYDFATGIGQKLLLAGSKFPSSASKRGSPCTPPPVDHGLVHVPYVVKAVPGKLFVHSATLEASSVFLFASSRDDYRTAVPLISVSANIM